MQKTSLPSSADLHQRNRKLLDTLAAEHIDTGGISNQFEIAYLAREMRLNYEQKFYYHQATKHDDTLFKRNFAGFMIELPEPVKDQSTVFVERERVFLNDGQSDALLLVKYMYEKARAKVEAVIGTCRQQKRTRISRRTNPLAYKRPGKQSELDYRLQAAESTLFSIDDMHAEWQSQLYTSALDETVEDFNLPEEVIGVMRRIRSEAEKYCK